MNFKEIISNIAEGFEFDKGEIVLLHFWGDNKDLDILDKIAIEIGKKGAFPLKFQQSREFNYNYYSEISNENLIFPEKFYEFFKLADSVIDIITYPIPFPHKNFPKEKMNEYRINIRNLMKNLMPNKKYYIQLRVPTEENSIESNLDFNIYSEKMLNAYNIDYKKLKAETSLLISSLEESKNVEIITGDNKILTFSIENRKWFKDDGCGDMPCGEIYIAPIEDSAFGSIIIPLINIENKIFKNVTLNFESGKLVYCSEHFIQEHISKFSGDYNKIAEFGIGLNENINDLCGYQLLDEKIKHTAHIAIGMNSMFGGKNNSNLHLDFIFYPKKINFDGKTFNL